MNELEHKRSGLMFVRHELFGLADGLHAYPRHDSQANDGIGEAAQKAHARIRRSEIDDLLYDFASDIRKYFGHLGRDIDDKIPGSAAIGTISDLKEAISTIEKNPKSYEQCRQELSGNIFKILGILQKNLEEVAKDYANLKRACRS